MDKEWNESFWLSMDYFNEICDNLRPFFDKKALFALTQSCNQPRYFFLGKRSTNPNRIFVWIRILFESEDFCCSVNVALVLYLYGVGGFFYFFHFGPLFTSFAFHLFYRYAVTSEYTQRFLWRFKKTKHQVYHHTNEQKFDYIKDR